MSEEIKVLNVQFLTSAKVSIEGHDADVSVFIDLANRKVYDKDMKEAPDGLSEVVFNYLDVVTALPADFFAAGEDIRKKAQQAYDEIKINKDQHLGNKYLGDADGWGSTTN